MGNRLMAFRLRNRASHPAQLSPLYVGKMSRLLTMVTATAWKKNGELWVTAYTGSPGNNLLPGLLVYMY